jgi:hypothetical protein
MNHRENALASPIMAVPCAIGGTLGVLIPAIQDNDLLGWAVSAVLAVGLWAWAIWACRSMVEYERRIAARERRTEREPWESWPLWMFSAPYEHELVWVMRHGWPHPGIWNPRTVHPATNVAGLHWKPWTGETLDHNGMVFDVVENGARAG